MSAPEIVTKPQLRSVVAEFKADHSSLPLFLALLERLMNEAPSLLERSATRQALIACQLVDREEFSRDSDTHRSLDQNEVFILWEMAHNQWYRRSPSAARIRWLNGERVGLWPFLETALRSLEPGILPKDSLLWNFEDKKLRQALWKRKRTHIFLWTIGQLLKAHTYA